MSSSLVVVFLMVCNDSWDPDAFLFILNCDTDQSRSHSHGSFLYLARRHARITIHSKIIMTNKFKNVNKAECSVYICVGLVDNHAEINLLSKPNHI